MFTNMYITLPIKLVKNDNILWKTTEHMLLSTDFFEVIEIVAHGTFGRHFFFSKDVTSPYSPCSAIEELQIQYILRFFLMDMVVNFCTNITSLNPYLFIIRSPDKM